MIPVKTFPAPASDGPLRDSPAAMREAAHFIAQLRDAAEVQSHRAMAMCRFAGVNNKGEPDDR